MSELHPGISERTFNAGEVTLNYAEGPAHGNPLVLLHGLGRRWQVFLPIIPSLSVRWHIFAPDLRGHGKSGRVPRGYHDVKYGEDVACFLRDRVSRPAVILGHSLGGMIGMWIAGRHPELVRALVLGDNMIIARRVGNPMYKALFTALSALGRRGGSLDSIAEGIGRIVLPVPGTEESIAIRELPGNDHAYLLTWARCVQQADPEIYDMTLSGAALEGWDGETILRGICCPTLLLQASPELGGLMTDADVSLATRVLPNHTLVRFPNLGHALFIHQPETVMRAVTDFLESV
jgi:pimeloyl-ACP methyl ester carboxylesterase